MSEYAELSTQQEDALRMCLDAYAISRDFCNPHFERFVRMYKLYKGVLPDELDGTFSKIMLNIAFATVQNELPRTASSLFSTPDFFTLTANIPELEFAAQDVQRWLKYQVEKKIRLWPRILPTLESVQIFGTGYRAVSHVAIKKMLLQRTLIPNEYNYPLVAEQLLEQETHGITSQDIEIFQGLPAPTGGIMNPQDGENESALDWFIWIDYMTERNLRQYAEQGVFDRAQVAKLLKNRAPDITGIDTEFKQKIAEAENGVGVTAKPDWLFKIANTRNLEKRHQILKCFFRNRWIFIGDNCAVLYDGAPSIDWIPIAKYVDTPDLNNHFGTGCIEVIEDLILAILLNFNHRMDWLAGAMHPTKFISQALIDHVNGDITKFDPRPYNTIPFPAKVPDIQRRVWYDRMPEITPQAFMEETGMKAYIQEIVGQSNYSKGMGGVGTLANETATGILSLIERGDARSTLKSLHTEYSGIHDELMLILKWARDWVLDDQVIYSGGGGFPWETIEAKFITDDYGITLNGTRGLTQKHQTVQKMLAMLPLFLNNPNVPGQKELLRQTLEASGIWENPSLIMGTTGMPQIPAMPMQDQGMARSGETGNQPNMTNMARSANGRSGVNAEGEIVPAEWMA